MGEPTPDIPESGSDPEPHRLDYAGPNAPKPRAEIGEPLSWGCIYAFAAMITSSLIIVRITDNSTALGFAWAVVIGGPILISIFVKRWRSFALGILIMAGVIFLILGTCGEILSRALRN